MLARPWGGKPADNVGVTYWLNYLDCFCNHWPRSSYLQPLGPAARTVGLFSFKGRRSLGSRQSADVAAAWEINRTVEAVQLTG